MKVYLSGIATTWKTDNIDQTVFTYISNNPGKNETEIATATTLTVDQVMWALDELIKQGKIAIIPESWSDYQPHRNITHPGR